MILVGQAGIRHSGKSRTVAAAGHRSAARTGPRTPFYETMREVSPGDVVFSFVDTLIAAIGVAQSYRWESPKAARVQPRPRGTRFTCEVCDEGVVVQSTAQ